jgi:hypothetical protein
MNPGLIGQFCGFVEYMAIASSAETGPWVILTLRLHYYFVGMFVKYCISLLSLSESWFAVALRDYTL